MADTPGDSPPPIRHPAPEHAVAPPGWRGPPIRPSRNPSTSGDSLKSIVAAMEKLAGDLRQHTETEGYAHRCAELAGRLRRLVDGT